MQRVLAIENQYISVLLRERTFHDCEKTIEDALGSILEHGDYIDREKAERDTSVKQIIACGIVTHGDRFLCLRRSARSNRPELRLNWTLIFGGHIDEEDRGMPDPILNCVTREIKEEVGLIPQKKPVLLGFVTDPATRVGQLHIGAVYRFESTTGAVKYTKNLDNLEFVNREKREEIKFCDIESINRLADRNRLDPWSEIFVHSYIGMRNGFGAGIEKSQFELPLIWPPFALS